MVVGGFWHSWGGASTALGATGLAMGGGGACGKGSDLFGELVDSVGQGVDLFLCFLLPVLNLLETRDPNRGRLVGELVF